MAFLCWCAVKKLLTHSLTHYRHAYFLIYLLRKGVDSGWISSKGTRNDSSRYKEGRSLTSTWPHLRCEVGLEKEEYYQNCLCATVLFTVIMVHKGTSSSWGQSTGSSFDLGWFTSLSSKRLYIFGIHGAIYILIFFVTFFLMSWARWDWPLTWLTIPLSFSAVTRL